MTGCKVYHRGDPEFEKIAAEILPIERVRSGLSHQGNTLTADQESYGAGRCNEDVKNIRGTL
jgi:hypothetical protein